MVVSLGKVNGIALVLAVLTQVTACADDVRKHSSVLEREQFIARQRAETWDVTHLCVAT
jgi:hypothetical protein